MRRSSSAAAVISWMHSVLPVNAGYVFALAIRSAPGPADWRVGSRAQRLDGSPVAPELPQRSAMESTINSPGSLRAAILALAEDQRQPCPLLVPDRPPGAHQVSRSWASRSAVSRPLPP